MPFKIVKGLLVAEHDRGNSGTIQRPSLIDDLAPNRSAICSSTGSQAIADRGRSDRRRQLPHLAPPTFRHGRLACSDAPGEAHNDHENEYCPTPRSRAVFSSSEQRRCAWSHSGVIPLQRALHRHLRRQLSSGRRRLHDCFSRRFPGWASCPRRSTRSMRLRPRPMLHPGRSCPRCRHRSARGTRQRARHLRQPA